MKSESTIDVIALLRQVFPPHPIDPTLAFEGTVYLDAVRFKQGASSKSWTELDPAFLEFHHDAPSFLAPAAFVEFLPAYLAMTLEPAEAIDVMPVSLLRALTRTQDTHETFDARMGRLTPEQRLAVARALAHLATTLDEGLWKRSAQRALRSYWDELLEGKRP